MKFSKIFLIFSTLFILVAEINGAHDAWIPLPPHMYSANSPTLSIVVNPSLLRLVDSGRNFDIPIHILLAEYPSMYHEFKLKFPSQKTI